MGIGQWALLENNAPQLANESARYSATITSHIIKRHEET